MKSLTSGLPPEIAAKVHPDWHKNEEAYWAARESLLSAYRDQWIAFANGSVLVAASTPLDVFKAIQKSDQHPFVIRVGHEEEPWYRIRRAVFNYDTTYPSAALPVVNVEFRAVSGTTGVVLDHVIPDTGADTTTLPWIDCQQMHLDPASGVPGVITGIAGGAAPTIGFLIWVWLDGQEYPCQLQALEPGNESLAEMC